MRFLRLVAVAALVSFNSYSQVSDPLPAGQEWYTEDCTDGSFVKEAWGDLIAKEPNILKQLRAMAESKYRKPGQTQVTIPNEVPLQTCWVRFPIKERRSPKDPIVSVNGMRTAILHDQWLPEGEDPKGGLYEAGIKIYYDLKKVKKLVDFEDTSNQCAEYDQYGNLIFISSPRMKKEVTVLQRTILGIARCQNANLCAKMNLLAELKTSRPEPTPVDPTPPVDPSNPAPIPETELPKLPGPSVERETVKLTRYTRKASIPLEGEGRKPVIHVSSESRQDVKN